jgi:hypothetical protein
MTVAVKNARESIAVPVPMILNCVPEYADKSRSAMSLKSLSQSFGIASLGFHNSERFVICHLTYKGTSNIMTGRQKTENRRQSTGCLAAKMEDKL